MKPIRIPAGFGRLKSALGNEDARSRRRVAVPTAPKSPVIQGLESEVEWRSHRDDVARGLAPVGDIEMALVEAIARLMWQQRRIRRLTEHLRRVVTREQEQRQAHSLSNGFSENGVRLVRLERLCAELDRQMVEAYERMHAEQDRRLRDVPEGSVPEQQERGIRRPAQERDGSRRPARAVQKHPSRRLR